MWNFFRFMCVFVAGGIIGWMTTIASVEDANRERNQRQLVAVTAQLSHCQTEDRNCEQAKTAAQEELRVANQLITQQGVAVMNCLLLRDPTLDSLPLPDPSLISPAPLAPSP